MKARKRKTRRSRRAKRGIYNAKKCSMPVHYRSGWELQFAQWLDASPKVASFRYEPYVIEYVSNQRTLRRRKYWPDFEVTYTDGTVQLIEIKPKKKLTRITNLKKFAAANAYCQTRSLTFRVLTEDDLKALGLLK